MGLKTLLSTRRDDGGVAFQSYRKGSRAEHELMDKLMAAGFLVIRAAGSGSGSPCPDLLAFRRTEQLGFECKAVNSTSLQLRKEQVEHLKRWEERSSITTYVAWRQTGGEWHFIRLQFLHENPKSYAISAREAAKVSPGLDAILGSEGKPGHSNS
jgi:Holliday junction resolvase